MPTSARAEDGALGIDGQRAQDYAANLQENLLSLIDRLKIGQLSCAASATSLH